MSSSSLASSDDGESSPSNQSAARQSESPVLHQANTAPRPNKLPALPISPDSQHDADAARTDSPPPLPHMRHLKTKNAHSKAITTAQGINTFGMLNQHPSEYRDFSVGVHDAQGARMTMEDAYSFVVDFSGIRGQGFFAIFDGHAGPEAAEWCGNHFHERLLIDLSENPNMPIPDVLNKTFLAVDTELSGLSSEKGSSSGCTAVTAFLRVEDAQGGQSFVDEFYMQRNSGLKHESTLSSLGSSSSFATMPEPSVSSFSDPDESIASISSTEKSPADSKKLSGSKLIKNAVRSLASGVNRSRSSSPAPSSSNTPRSSSPQPPIVETGSLPLKRVLYTANAGDARAVLCRAGKAVRLTYDHKGADRQEAKRIQDAGGFVLNNRVNGVLAVTRSLGDSSMKEFVVGAPYTTETPLGSDDEFLILACDGLWDVASDQQAVDLIRDEQNANAAAKTLMQHALDEGTRDNVTLLFVRFNNNK